MRAFFLALLMANLVFFAWAQGYLGDTGSGHEPQRLAEQLRPETMQLLRQLPPARDDDTVSCKRIENLTAAAAQAIRTEWEAQAGWTVSQKTGPTVKEYWVVIPALATEQLAEKKRSELSQLGVTDVKITADERNGPYVVSLSTFAEESAAKRYYETLAGKGVRSARLLWREKTALSLLELRGPAKKIEQRIKDLALVSPVQVTECAAADAGSEGTSR